MAGDAGPCPADSGICVAGAGCDRSIEGGCGRSGVLVGAIGGSVTVSIVELTAIAGSAFTEILVVWDICTARL